MKERTDDNLAKNLSLITREAEQRELRLRDDMEKLRIQQEQTLGTLDTKIDAMMERRTQAIMDRLDGLLGGRSGSKMGSRTRENPTGSRGLTSMNNRIGEGHKDPLEEVASSLSGYATGDNRTRCPNIRGSSTGNRQT